MDLSGPWRAAALDPELNRSGADPDLDDGSWPTVEVPGHWNQSDSFGDTEGPVLLRRRFTSDPTPEGKRSWLCLDGVLASSDVWLDGSYLGDTVGYFVPHQFEVTDHLRASHDHALTVEVSCPDQSHARAKQSLTGSLQAGPLSPGGNPGGIWRPVHIDQTGPVTILWSRLLCTAANEKRAELKLRLVIDAAEAGTIRIDTSVTGPDGVAAAGGVGNHAVAHGENRIEWNVDIEDPSLWWPAALGAQPLYEVAIAIRTSNNAVSDRRHWRTGLRKISVSNMIWRVNGERLFVKGISLGPQSGELATLEPRVMADDLRAAREAGLDLVRVHGHVARPELYEAADRQGVLLWQDLPLVGGYATSTRKVARSVARAAVDLLGHHPSVAVWCAHDEPNGPPLPEPNERHDEAPPTARRLSRHLMPSWNRSVLDPLLKRELKSADPSRSVIARSGSLPLITDLSSSDAHLWLGWHNGVVEDLPVLLRKWPRLGAFLGGFGSQSVTVEDWDDDEPTWPTAQRGAFERYLPRRAYSDGEAWAAASQAYQADLLRFHIETIRRLKFRPSGGFCLMALTDADHDGGFGILDIDRTPKPAFHAVLDACRPVVIVADNPEAITTPGETLDIDIHAISDLHASLGQVTVKAVARCGSWRIEQEWSGELEANSCMLVGTLAFTVPEVNGQLIIDLHLVANEQVATNRYQTVVIPRAEATTRTTAEPRS